MRKTLTSTTAAVALAAVMALPALAQEATPQPDTQPGTALEQDYQDRDAATMSEPAAPDQIGEQTPEQVGEQAPEQTAQQAGDAPPEEVRESGSLTSADADEAGAPPASQALDPEAIAGLPVHDAAGNRVGRVADVEMGASGPERLIVSHGGFLGMGARRVAVEWQDAFVDEDRVVLDMSEDQVSELPEYEPSAQQ